MKQPSSNDAQLRVIANLAAPVSSAAGLYVIGVDGRGGAGKSAFARSLADMVTGGATIVQMDDFYLPSAVRPVAPDSFTDLYDRERLHRELLTPLEEGSPASYQRYDWQRDELAGWHEVEPSGVVMLEGITATAGDVRDMLDLAIWIDTPHETCLERGIERDGEGSRGLWERFWAPAEQAYIEDERPHLQADIVVPGAGGCP